MNCKEFHNELKNWLESKLLKEMERVSDEVSAEKTLSKSFFIHAKECKNCCSHYEGAIFLVSGRKLQKQPPPWLPIRIEKALEKTWREEATKKSIIRKAISLFTMKNILRFKKWIAIPLTGSLVLTVLIVLLLLFIVPISNHYRKNTVTIHLYFEAPGAKRVSVVGDWNGWDPSVDIMKDPEGDGIWEIEIRLQAGGEYQYQFIIDGKKWVPDPNAPLQVDDGFGSKNSILHI